MPIHPRVVALATAVPAYSFTQDVLAEIAIGTILGPGWRSVPESVAHGKRIERLFASSGVRRRHSAVDLATYYAQTKSTGQRMEEYQKVAYDLGHEALRSALIQSGSDGGCSISDLAIASCTGYSAPGLDVQLSRDLDLPRDVRRTVIGHMGCFGAMVGLRHGLAAIRADPAAAFALVSVELSTLHFAPTLETDPLTSFALFGDAAAALIMRDDPDGIGPEVVDAYCVADFESASQMTWTITDQGFVMSLSPRVPVSLRRVIGDVVARLLGRNGLSTGDVTHWLIHPGGPSILDAIQRRLELSDAQMSVSRQVLRDYGNCSSTTVLLILDAVLRSNAMRKGEWGVMMAFGPGLTLETCLLRF